MRRLALAVALLIGLATPSQADYRDGMAAYARGIDIAPRRLARERRPER